MTTLTNDQINALINAGGSRWTRGDHDRVYFNEDQILEMIGLSVSYYNTGNISSATYGGAHLSNNRARKMVGEVRSAKVYVDVATGDVKISTYGGDVDWDEVRSAIEALLAESAPIPAPAPVEIAADGAVDLVEEAAAAAAVLVEIRRDADSPNALRAAEALGVFGEHQLDRTYDEQVADLLAFLEAASALIAQEQDRLLPGAPELDDRDASLARLRAAVAMAPREGIRARKFRSVVNQLGPEFWAELDGAGMTGEQIAGCVARLA